MNTFKGSNKTTLCPRLSYSRLSLDASRADGRARATKKAMKGTPKQLAKDFPLRKTKCQTCPFGEYGSVEVRIAVESRVLSEASQTCHHVKDKALCRGARDFQLMIFHRIGMLDAPTDEAWDRKRKEMGV